MAADVHYPAPLNDLDGDAEFDALWNTYTSVVENGLESGDNHMTGGGSSPLDPFSEPSPQSLSSLTTTSLQELVDSNHASAIAHKDSPVGAVGVGMNSLFMTVQILYLSSHP